MDLLSYVEKLIEHDIKIIPIKSFGKDHREAKEPLLPKGFSHTRYKSKEYIRTANKLTRKTYYLIKSDKITAYGLLGAINNFIILDFDKDKFPCGKYEHIFKTLARDLFTEWTSRGGIHVIIRARSDDDLHLNFPQGMVRLIIKHLAI